MNALGLIINTYISRTAFLLIAGNGYLRNRAINISGRHFNFNHFQRLLATSLKVLFANITSTDYDFFDDLYTGKKVAHSGGSYISLWVFGSVIWKITVTQVYIPNLMCSITRCLHCDVWMMVSCSTFTWSWIN